MLYGEFQNSKWLAGCFTGRIHKLAQIYGRRITITYIFLSIQCVEILRRGFLYLKIKMFSGLQLVCKPGKPEKEAQGTPDAEESMHAT